MHRQMVKLRNQHHFSKIRTFGPQASYFHEHSVWFKSWAGEGDPEKGYIKKPSSMNPFVMYKCSYVMMLTNTNSLGGFCSLVFQLGLVGFDICMFWLVLGPFYALDGRYWQLNLYQLHDM